METPIERHRRLLPYFERFKVNIDERIGELTKEMNDFELDPDDYAGQYEDYLDENYGPVEIGSLSYAPSYVLKNIDETAYNLGLSAYMASINNEDVPAYKDLADEHESLTDTLTEVETYIEVATELLEEYDDPETTDVERLSIIEQQLDTTEPVEPRSWDPAHDLLPVDDDKPQDDND